MTVREYLQKKNFQYKEVERNGKTNAIMNCPFCGDTENKFAINLENGAFNCFHENKCGKKGSWWDFQKELGDVPQKINSENNFLKINKKEFKRPQGIKKSELSGAVLDYLKSRKFTEKTLAQFRISQKDNETVMFPTYKEGKLVDIFYRNIHEKSKMFHEKDAEPCLFNLDNCKGEELFLTEGQYDAMALYEYGIDAASVPNGATNLAWIDTEWDRLERFKRIYICFDNDSAGEEGVRRLVQRLGMWRCVSVNFPDKDANESLINGRSLEDMMVCIASAQEFSPDYMACPSNFTDKIVEYFKNPESITGTPTFLKELDTMIGGWRDEEVTVWTGLSGAGKSTILNQHWLDLIAKDVKVCVVSLEMPPHRYLRWSLLQHYGNSLITEEQIVQALKWMDNKLYVLNTTNYITKDEIFNHFEYAVRRYDVKHFIIDSLMKIKFPNKDENNEAKDFMNELQAFCKKYSCHTHVVAHLRKPGMHDKEPTKYSIYGSSNIVNLADNILVLFRHEEAEQILKYGCDAYLKTLKAREGNLQKVDLFFDKSSKRYTTHKPIDNWYCK